MILHRTTRCQATRGAPSLTTTHNRVHTGGTRTAWPAIATASRCALSSPYPFIKSSPRLTLTRSSSSPPCEVTPIHYPFPSQSLSVSLSSLLFLLSFPFLFPPLLSSCFHAEYRPLAGAVEWPRPNPKGVCLFACLLAVPCMFALLFEVVACLSTSSSLITAASSHRTCVVCVGAIVWLDKLGIQSWRGCEGALLLPRASLHHNVSPQFPSALFLPDLSLLVRCNRSYSFNRSSSRS